MLPELGTWIGQEKKNTVWVGPQHTPKLCDVLLHLTFLLKIGACEVKTNATFFLTKLSSKFIYYISYDIQDNPIEDWFHSNFFTYLKDLKNKKYSNTKRWEPDQKGVKKYLE